MNINQECSMSQEGILKNLQDGLASEQRAHDLCADLLTLLESEDDKAIIKKIMLDEERHIQMTQDLINLASTMYKAQYQK
jgi:rubrerythrin